MEEYIKEFIEEIKAENDLPSGAGYAFKDLILNSEYNLGFREWDIIANWAREYADLRPEDKEELEKELKTI